MASADINWAKILLELAEDYEKLKDIHDTLKQSDALLKAVIPYFQDHTRPNIPHNGSVEYGILPYWAKNPTKIPDHKDIPEFVLDLIKFLREVDLIPEPTITDADYAILLQAVDHQTAIAPDGTLYGTGPFEQLNPKWLEALSNSVLVEYDYKKHPFFADLDNKGCQKPAILDIAPGTMTFAVTGDWGTGAADAIAVRDAAMTKAPDYLIHLGDVYYTGTPSASDGKFFFGPNNEVANLIDFWPKPMRPGRSFTMNSNHEMYPGGWGLFCDTLKDPTFLHQKGRSYFMLENEYWQIFGLDSAYCSPDFLYMYGALNDEQIAFVHKHRNSDKKWILMTHHTPYDVTGREEEIYKGTDKSGKAIEVSLLQQVTQAFRLDDGTDRLPDYWYFGHIHDGIVYTQKDGCNMRCAGHASMPYGAPWVLTVPGTKPPFNTPEKKKCIIKGVEFFACTPKKPDCPAGQVKNGFMTFTLDRDRISEAYYDSEGACTWQS